jgi:hypothetical protein
MHLIINHWLLMMMMMMRRRRRMRRKRRRAGEEREERGLGGGDVQLKTNRFRLVGIKIWDVICDTSLK